MRESRFRQNLMKSVLDEKVVVFNSLTQLRVTGTAVVCVSEWTLGHWMRGGSSLVHDNGWCLVCHG